jgi:capsular polysaccharide biosynthesis protein
MEKYIKSNELDINFKELLYVILKKSWIILMVAVICAAGAGYYSKNYIQPVYTSYAKLYIINRQQGTTTTMNDLQTGASLVKDYLILVKSRPVTEEVIDTLKLDMSNAMLAKAIDVYNPTDTRVMIISVKNSDPGMAKQIVDSIAIVSSKRMESIMGIEKVNVVEDGNYPDIPSSPNIMKNIKLAGCLGAIAAAFIIVLVYLYNDSIKSSEDVERYLGLITFGYIPIEDKLRKNSKSKPNKIKKRKYKAGKLKGEDYNF